MSIKTFHNNTGEQFLVSLILSVIIHGMVVWFLVVWAPGADLLKEIKRRERSVVVDVVELPEVVEPPEKPTPQKEAKRFSERTVRVEKETIPPPSPPSSMPAVKTEPQPPIPVPKEKIPPAVEPMEEQSKKVPTPMDKEPPTPQVTVKEPPPVPSPAEPAFEKPVDENFIVQPWSESDWSFEPSPVVIPEIPEIPERVVEEEDEIPVETTPKGPPAITHNLPEPEPLPARTEPEPQEMMPKESPMPPPLPEPQRTVEVEEAQKPAEGTQPMGIPTEPKLLPLRPPSPPREEKKKPINLFPTEERIARLTEQYEKEAPREKKKTLQLNTSELKYYKYLMDIKQKIELRWEYPAIAIREGWQGRLRIDFTIRKDGSIEKIELIKSSNYPALDDAAITAIRLATPFNPFPRDFNIETINIRAQFIYEFYRPRH